ncbi:MAG: hypothetical protein QF577_10955, partial [Phycisphaerae bacterium]|nr:hypothetical protein [Phycisphaerae bacterium]
TNSVKANLIRCVLRRVFTAILGCDYRKDAAYESGGYQSCEADPFHQEQPLVSPHIGHTRHEPARCMGAAQKGHAVPPVCIVQAGAGVSKKGVLITVTVSVIQ